MKKLIYLILFYLSISLSVTAQSNEFKVLCKKGKCMVNTEPLFTGMALTTNDKIVLEKDAYLGLLHKSGKTLEIKTAGTYDIKIISLKVTNVNSSISEKYLKFVTDELLKEDKEDIKKNYRKHMNIAGSVERGDKLRVCLPKTSTKINLIDSLFTFNWCSTVKGATYMVRVYNDDNENEVVPIISTKDTSITLDLSKIEIGTKNEFYIKVYDKSKSEKEFRQFIVDTNSDILEQVNSLNYNLKEPTAVNYYLKGLFYEQNNYFVEALKNYKKALELDSTVETYKDSYNNLLFSNKLEYFIKR